MSTPVMDDAGPAAAARRIEDTVYEIDAGFRSDMKVPARVYAADRLWEQIATDRSLEQLVNVAALPGVTRPCTRCRSRGALPLHGGTRRTGP